MSWALLLACGGPSLVEPLAPPRTAVESALASKRVAEGEALELTVRVSWAEGWAPDLSGLAPVVDGLEVRLVEERTFDEERAVSLQTWSLEGPPGSYLLPPLEVSFLGPAGEERTESSAPLYADIGEGGPTSELQPMALAPPPPDHPWWPWALGAAALAGVVAVVGRRRRRDPEEAGEEPVPADEAALAAWDELRARPGLDDHALALGLSRLFRVYVEAVLGVPATTATGFEIIAALEGRLPGDVDARQRSRRLLQATDLIKFARKGGGQELFEGLDRDLRAVIAATRPEPELEPEFT